jgi:hypothetical protein
VRPPAALSSDISPTRIGRLLLLTLLSWWTVVFVVRSMRDEVVGPTFLHLISSSFHEAGHILFSPFGDLMTSFGGRTRPAAPACLAWGWAPRI